MCVFSNKNIVMMLIKNIKTKKGFSIGEVMVAAFILLFGIVSAIFLTARSINQIGSSRDAIVATSLAQEGTELVRNVRDNSVTQQTCATDGVGSGTSRCTAFNAFVKNSDISYGWPSYTAGRNWVACSVSYELEPGTEKGLLCTHPQNTLYLNEETGFYTHDAGGNKTTDSRFKRHIYLKYQLVDGSIMPTTPTDEELNKIVLLVTSVVVWGNTSLPNVNDIDEIDQKCKIQDNCAFAQTKLTSWINL